MLYRLMIVALFSVIAACTVTDQREVDRAHNRSTDDSTELPKNTQTSGDGLQGLMDRANRQIETGELRAGLSTLERALRIAPRDPAIYLSMALVYLQLDEPPLAANMARRGLLYCERSKICKDLEAIGGQ